MQADLLAPRFEAIADFWENPFKIGDVLTFTHEREPLFPPFEEMEAGNVTNHLFTEFIPCKDGGSAMYDIEGFKPYPHLFRNMRWDEKRTLEEMPEYVKLIQKPDGGSYWEVGAIMEVDEWKLYSKEDYAKLKIKGSKWFCEVGKTHRYNTCDLEPSTVEEYKQYKIKDKL